MLGFTVLRMTALLAASTVASSPPPAPADGYAACSVMIPSYNRLIYTSPLPATQADAPAMAAAFALAMQQRIYPGEPAIQMVGDCHWAASSQAATAYLATIKHGATARGMTVMGMSYTPAAAR